MTANDGWIDLTHVISPGVPRLAKFAPPGADGAPVRVLARPRAAG